MTAKNKTKKELQAYIEALEAKVSRLSIDPSYGILSRQALELEISGKANEIKFVAFLDVDYLHSFNEQHGHEEANSRIARALHLRSSDLVLSGKWYSGDEVALLLAGDPEAFCNRQREAFEREGLSITIAWVEFSGDLVSDVTAAKKIVFDSKAARGVTGR